MKVLAHKINTAARTDVARETQLYFLPQKITKRLSVTNLNNCLITTSRKTAKCGQHGRQAVGLKDILN